jgi:hypothetical protein
MTTDTQAYPGTGQPADYASQFNAIAFVASQLINQIWTGTLVQVLAVHGGGVNSPPTVDVHPLVNQVDSQGNSTPHGTIYGLPCARNQSGAEAIICDPKVNDIGWAAIADHDISSVQASGGQANPGSARRFSPSDGVYLLTLLGATPTTFIQFDGSGNINITTPTGDAVNITTGTANITATTVNLGASGGPAVARIGDSVDLSTGKILTGSSKVFAA